MGRDCAGAVPIQHIFSLTELNWISHTYCVPDCWLMFKSQDVISTLIKVNPWGRDTWQSWLWHLSTVLLFEVQPSLLIIYFTAGRQETVSLSPSLSPSTSHLTDEGAGTLSPLGLEWGGGCRAGAKIRIIRIISPTYTKQQHFIWPITTVRNYIKAEWEQSIPPFHFVTKLYNILYLYNVNCIISI